MVCSPRFRPQDNNKRVAALCEKYGIPFIDFSDTPYFNDRPELFYDARHLNDDGAHIFTAMLFEQLKPYLPKP
jgi:lysophospholipase L1-like esterase